MTRKTKLRAGKLKIPCVITDTGGRLEFQFNYCPALMAEIKAMEGAKWHGFDDYNPRKIWSVKKSTRNLFQLAYLEGQSNPFERYDRPLREFTPKRPTLFFHQCGIAQHVLTRHYCEIAAEMGTGKTLALIEVMEQSGCSDWWWVAPKTALRSVELEFRKWGATILPRFLTYENLVKILKNWEPSDPPPEAVVFDEASRAKSPNAQRSQAALHLANAIREKHGENGYVVLMSGSPAPKSPLDWWMQCEIACPGYLKEGDIHKFRQRLAITAKHSSVTGGQFQKIVTWRDNVSKCDICGELSPHSNHNMALPDRHQYQPSQNEIEQLYKRMQGLVYVLLKKDCLDLPEKQYRTITCQPHLDIVRAAKLIATTSPTAIQALTLMRELSDGFQYREVTVGKKACCDGVKGRECGICFGKGEIHEKVRQTVEVPCPKDEVLGDLLDDHEDFGRIVIYAGFTGSIDRICRIVQKNGWEYIRVDGRGWQNTLALTDPLLMLETFQNDSDIRRIAFIGHPGSAGMGITLTASPSVVYFSNDFNAESRIQSEDRIHRPGCRGANIIDIVHLPTDLTVIENLKKKRVLQGMTMGEIDQALLRAA
jgi:hypothetical protein